MEHGMPPYYMGDNKNVRQKNFRMSLGIVHPFFNEQISRFFCSFLIFSIFLFFLVFRELFFYLSDFFIGFCFPHFKNFHPKKKISSISVKIRPHMKQTIHYCRDFIPIF